MSDDEYKDARGFANDYGFAPDIRDSQATTNVRVIRDSQTIGEFAPEIRDSPAMNDECESDEEFIRD